jgi:thiamine-phosphate pyrophosphorylase
LIFYYITDRSQFPGDETSRRRFLLDKIGEAVESGVDFIQLREKDLPIRELEMLARETVRLVHRQPHEKTRLLINSRSDVVMASAADGVHLRSDDVSPREVRALWRDTDIRIPLIGASCHSPADVQRAKNEGANFAVFGPVFGKKNGDSQPVGMDLLRQACAIGIPVLGLGGITLENAHACVEAGAAGIAGIRLFQEDEIAEVVRRLRV